MYLVETQLAVSLRGNPVEPRQAAAQRGLSGSKQPLYDKSKHEPVEKGLVPFSRCLDAHQPPLKLRLAG